MPTPIALHPDRTTPRPNKTYFFNAARDCFIAYSLGADVAVALGDPVGPEEKIEETLRAFRQYCEDNGWGVAFHQTPPDFLPHYQRAGFKKLKIGDDAQVDLTKFNLDGRERKKLRQSVKHLEKTGPRLARYEPPISEELLSQLQQVSDEWLSLPGRRERTFSLGLFDRNYVRATPVAAVEDASGRIQAFVNVIPSYAPGTTTVDLMRHRLDAPNGVMDFLLVKNFEQCRLQGFNYFDLGMVPLSGFSEKEQPTQTERAVYFFLRRLSPGSPGGLPEPSPTIPKVTRKDSEPIFQIECIFSLPFPYFAKFWFKGTSKLQSAYQIWNRNSHTVFHSPYYNCHLSLSQLRQALMTNDNCNMANGK